MKTKVWFLASLLILTAFTQANIIITQTIRGSVLDATTGYPLIGANIVLIGSEPFLGSSSNINGEFELNMVPLGRQSIQISYLGYKPQTISNLLITSGKETQIQIFLEEDVTLVDEITVKARSSKEKPLNEMATVSARTFSVEETERFAGSLGDPARMVANYAGVAMQNDARNDIIIRGNSPSGVLWKLEGIEIANPNHFAASGTTGGPVSMINNNLLANSEFLTGAFPAEYGNAISGVFDLNLRSGNQNNNEFVGQIGFNGFELGAEGPLFETHNNQKASYLANFRYSTLEVLSEIGFSAGTGTAIPRYKDFTFLVDIPGTKAGRFKVFGLWGQSFIALGSDFTDTIENAYNGKGTTIDFGSGIAMIGASHTYFFNEKTRIISSLSYQSTYNTTVFDSVRNQGEEIVPFLRAKNEEDKLTFSTHLKYKLNARNNFSIGITGDQYMLASFDSVYLHEHQKFINILDLKGSLLLFQAHAQWQHKFNKSITTYSGIHAQYFNSNESFAIEPRLGFNWQINTQHSFNAGFGMHSQLQPKATYFVETYVDESDSYFRTNENLDFTKSNHFVLGYNYLINQDVRIKLESYYQALYHVPVKNDFPAFSMINMGTDFGPATIDSLVNKGKGTNIGIEFTLEKFLNNGYYFLLTTSIFDSKYTGADGIERNTAFNGNYVFNLLAGYEYKFNEKFMLTFDIRGTLAGGKRYVPVDKVASQIEGSTEYNWDNAYTNKYKDYFRTDLRIGFKHNGNKFTQEWGIDLQNLTNYKSIYMEQYDAEKNEVYQIFQQGFMPMVLYRIQF